MENRTDSGGIERVGSEHFRVFGLYGGKNQTRPTGRNDIVARMSE